MLIIHVYHLSIYSLSINKVSRAQKFVFGFIQCLVSESLAFINRYIIAETYDFVDINRRNSDILYLYTQSTLPTVDLSSHCYQRIIFLVSLKENIRKCNISKYSKRIIIYQAIRILFMYYLLKQKFC